MSNVLGTVNPVREIVALGHAVGAAVVLDASQAVPQLPVDVVDLGADLVAFTGHKMVGPTGIGVLWGRYDLLAELPPFLGGGEMIEVVRMTGSTFAAPPHRFEAGTPPIAQAVGLGAAAGYLSAIGMDAIAAHEQQITAYALEGLKTVPGLRIIGPSEPVGPRGSGGVHAAGHPPARHQPAARQPGDRRPRWAPLRPSAARAVRGAVLDPGVVLPVHDDGRDRRPGGGSRLHPAVLRRWAMKVEDLYQEIILDHYRAKHHSGLREPYEAEVHAGDVNPSCGDEVTLRLHVADGVVDDVSYEGVGCSISQASTSVMTDLVIGQPVGDGLALHEEFLTMMQSKGTYEPDEEQLEDAVAFVGVARFPGSG